MATKATRYNIAYCRKAGSFSIIMATSLSVMPHYKKNNTCWDFHMLSFGNPYSYSDNDDILLLPCMEFPYPLSRGIPLLLNTHNKNALSIIPEIIKMFHNL